MCLAGGTVATSDVPQPSTQPRMQNSQEEGRMLDLTNEPIFPSGGGHGTRREPACSQTFTNWDSWLVRQRNHLLKNLGAAKIPGARKGFATRHKSQKNNTHIDAACGRAPPKRNKKKLGLLLLLPPPLLGAPQAQESVLVIEGQGTLIGVGSAWPMMAVPGREAGRQQSGMPRGLVIFLRAHWQVREASNKIESCFFF
ncbi:hypothetical protein T439DRAFT_320908 [Meredithblackwellia eburnea MCA 4105]